MTGIAPSPSVPPPPTPPADASKGLGSRIATLAVGTALMMQFIDSTALSTALPTLAVELNTSPVHLRIVLTTYLVVQALFLPASGWIADRFGARRVFLIAMAVFLLGSLLGGFCHTLPQLVGARIVQGLGGSMMMPVGRIIVVASSPREKLLQAMMWLTLPVVAGPIFGPPLAGFILDVASWPWIFFVNIPVGLAGMAAVARFVPKLDQPPPGRFDFVGFTLAAVAIAGVMTVMDSVGHGLIWQVLAGAVALGAATLYPIHSRRRIAAGGRPVLDLSLLKVPTFRDSQLGGGLMRLGVGGTPYLLALLLQTALHWSPSYAGLVIVSGAVGSLVVRAVGARMTSAWGFRKMLLSSCVIGSVLTLAPGGFRAETPVIVIASVLFAAGVLRTLQFSSVNTLVYADVPSQSISAAATLAAVMQQMTISLGITIAALTLQISQGNNVLTPHAFVFPFAVLGGLGLLSLFFYWRLPANSGADMTPVRRKSL